MGCCCFGSQDENDEEKPLLGDKKKDEKDVENKGEKDVESTTKKTSKLDFVKLEVREFDKVFDDYARTLNPFVTDREKLEQAVKKFKTSVESLQEVRPQATFREYLKTLKTTLKNEGVFIKIKNGAVTVYGVGSRSVKAVQDSVDAIKSILSTSESIKDMPEVITSASGSAIEDAEATSENLEHIIRREFSGVFDMCKVVRFKKNLKNNLKKLKTSPKMVQEFCEEVKIIVEDISKAFDEDREDDDDDDEAQGETKADEAAAKTESQKSDEVSKESQGIKKDKDEKKRSKDSKDEEKKREEKDRKGKDSKKDKKKEEGKKPDFQKQLKMENVGLADIDKIFTDVMSTLNGFVATREKLQQAKESFQKIMKTICNFDGEKEFKEYMKELKKKAKEGDLHIYIDTTNNDIRLDSVKGVDPPAPYRNAVKALNDVKAAALKTVDLEPDVQNGLEACAKDIVNIEPVKDFKKMVSGAKEVMALPKKVKAFNENRKKVQKAPQIVKEFCGTVKEIIVDITKAFTEDEETEKKDEAGKEKDEEEKNEGAEKDENEEDEKQNGEEKEKDDQETGKQEVVATVHVPRKSDDNEEVEQDNKSVIV